MRNVLASVAVAAVVFAASAQGASVPVRGLAPVANDLYVQKQATVEYGDLNPADKQGAATLLARINSAALAACSGARQPHSREIAGRIEKCRVRAVTDAVSQVDSPELAAAANAK